MGSVIVVVAVVVFWLWAIFDALTTDPARVRTLPKLAWVLITVAFLEFGALAWVVFGRPRRSLAAVPPLDDTDTLRPGQPPQRSPRAGRPVGPDDDPDFLKSL